ncbi:hypothetical protein [Paraburkholderia sp. A3RO-2L]|uniref:hypothetical protein n=1 Tax=Paraburkholderia sp. A3RO-2L TaxID=3028376 RepID=UPI003DA9D1C1
MQNTPSLSAKPRSRNLRWVGLWLFLALLWLSSRLAGLTSGVLPQLEWPFNYATLLPLTAIALITDDSDSKLVRRVIWLVTVVQCAFVGAATSVLAAFILNRFNLLESLTGLPDALVAGQALVNLGAIAAGAIGLLMTASRAIAIFWTRH